MELGEGAKGKSPYPLSQTPTPNPLRGLGGVEGRAGELVFPRPSPRHKSKEIKNAGREKDQGVDRQARVRRA